MPTRPPTPERLARAAAVLADIRSAVQSVLDRVPGSPAPQLRIPATLGEYDTVVAELVKHLLSSDPSLMRHPAWEIWRIRSLQFNDAAFEAVDTWSKALCDVEDWARYKSRPDSILTDVQARVQRRLARIDAQIPLYGTVNAIRALAADLGGTFHMIDRVDRRATEDDLVAAIVDYHPDVEPEDVAVALARHHLTPKPVEVIAARAGASPETFFMVTDQLRDLSTPQEAPGAGSDLGGCPRP